MGVRACACSPVHTTYESVMVAGKYISFHGIHMAYRPADCVSIRGALQLAMDTIVLGYSLQTNPKSFGLQGLLIRLDFISEANCCLL